MTNLGFPLPRKGARFAVFSWLAICLVTTAGLSQQAAPDLSGTWKLNVKDSKQGAIRGSVVLEIKQSGSVLNMRHRYASGDNRVFSYTVDGKEHVADFTKDGVTMAKTYWEGDTLVVENHNHDNNRSFVADTYFNCRYSLSADQKSLVVSMRGMRPPVSDLHAELVYQRQ
jgi:hypothetical protein